MGAPIVPGLAVPVAGLQAGRTPPALAGRFCSPLWPLAQKAKAPQGGAMCECKAGAHRRQKSRSPDLVEDEKDQWDAYQEAQSCRVKHHAGGLHHRVNHGAVILQ